MKHYIENNMYYIEDNDGKVILTIKLLDEESEMLKNQIEVSTKDEIYTGPVEFLLKR